MERAVPCSRESPLLSQPALSHTAIYYCMLNLQDIYSQLWAAVERRYIHCWKLFIWEFLVSLQINAASRQAITLAKCTH